MAKEKKAEEQAFEKRSLLKSAMYAEVSDILQAILEDGKTYTIEQANSLLENYRKRAI
jgi:dihydroneopterin aldolase